MHRVTAGLACLIFSIAASNHAFSADNTRTQHRDWMRKLDTPGGTLPESLHVIMERDAFGQIGPGGTAAQHRSWIKKLEISDYSNGVSL
jgi:hypothetical protein